MPDWAGLGDRLQGGPPPDEPGLGDRLLNQWKASLANRILAAPSKLFGGLVVDPAYQASTLAGRMIRGEVPTWRADPQTADMHIAPELQDEAANAAGMLTLGAGAIPAEANSLRMGIKAYHGSPHDFERFDASKIGTGEGAQAYGHGLYMAENEAVAREYRDNLTGLRTSAATRALNDAGGDVDAAIAGVKAEIDRLRALPNAGNDAAKRNRFISINEEKLAELGALKNSGSMSKGRMYEVDIAAEPEHFLDWDKPLSEQSPKVATPDILEAVRQEANSRAMSATHQDRRDQLFGMVKDPMKAPGEFVVEAMAPRGRGGTRPQELSQKLKDMGIPGIRYLDQGSRGMAMYDVGSPRADFGPYTPFRNKADAEKQLALLKRMGETDAEIREIGKQTSNYVVFDDKLISILKKYGLPISAAGLAALSQMQGGEAQAAPLGDRLQGR